MYITQLDSPVGKLTMAGDGQAITGLWIQGQKYDRATLPAQAQVRDDLPVFGEARRWLDAYFGGKDPGALPPLAPVGSAFRQAVWARLLRIPRGSVVTYGDIAQALSKPAQAVGGAVGHNPISILIPCHRVVGATGNLTGYAGGLAAKEHLLRLEGVDMAPLFIPNAK